MSFIRAKEIPPGSGNWYDYEVETIHEGDKVIQRHIRYIGKSSRGGVSHATPLSRGLLSRPATIHKMKTPTRLIASAMGMYYGGMSLDAIQQQFIQDHELDMSESNYWNWVVRFTEQAVKQCKGFKPKVGDVWVADQFANSVTKIPANGQPVSVQGFTLPISVSVGYWEEK